MTIFKTVGSITKTVEGAREIDEQPKYNIGDYVEVYCGSWEGHHFWIKDIRYNDDQRRFEFLYGGGLMGGWYAANHLRLHKRTLATSQATEEK